MESETEQTGTHPVSITGRRRRMHSTTRALSESVADANTSGQRLQAADHALIALSPTESTTTPSKSSARTVEPAFA